LSHLTAQCLWKPCRCLSCRWVGTDHKADLLSNHLSHKKFKMPNLARIQNVRSAHLRNTIVFSLKRRCSIHNLGDRFSKEPNRELTWPNSNVQVYMLHPLAERECRRLADARRICATSRCFPVQHIFTFVVSSFLNTYYPMMAWQLMQIVFESVRYCCFDCLSGQPSSSQFRHLLSNLNTNAPYSYLEIAL
jgi:hypothetical protein